MPNSVLLSANRKAIGGKEMVRAIGGIIGRFGNKYDLGRLRGSYLEVDIGDMRSENRLLGIIGRDGTLQLHVQSTSPQYITLLIHKRYFFFQKWEM